MFLCLSYHVYAQDMKGLRVSSGSIIILAITRKLRIEIHKVFVGELFLSTGYTDQHTYMLTHLGRMLD